MNRYALEEFHRNPALLDRLIDQAHRERAEAVHAGFAWLWKQAGKLVPQAHGHPGRWIERLG